MTAREQNEIICTCICRQTELYGEWARRHGMSYNTMMTLYALDQRDGITQKEITEGWLLPKQTVHTVVKELERLGYVRFGTGRDKKEKRIFFTDEGHAYARERLGDLYALEDRALEAIGAQAAQAVVTGQLAFTAAFEQEVRHV